MLGYWLCKSSPRQFGWGSIKIIEGLSSSTEPYWLLKCISLLGWWKISSLVWRHYTLSYLGVTLQKEFHSPFACFSPNNQTSPNRTQTANCKITFGEKWETNKTKELHDFGNLCEQNWKNIWEWILKFHKKRETTF